MHWYRTTSLACCGSTLVAVIGLLALSSFYVYDNQKNIPGDTTDKWMTHVTAIVPLTVVWALSSIYALWVILAKNRKWFFLGLLIWNFLCFATCVYFNVAFQLQYDKPKLKADELFTKTQTAIKQQLGKDKIDKFVPVWLDNIQNKSKECCGIRTFRDWEEFWPEHDYEIPKSCCKEPTNSEKCLTNLIAIPFPGVPSMFIKTDTGCIDEINAHMQKNIYDCFIFLMILSILFGLSEVAYLIQFCVDGTKYGNEFSEDAGGDRAPVPETTGSSSNRFFGFFQKKRDVKSDIEDGAPGDSGDLYDVNGVASGSLATSASGYTASQGTLPDSASQDPFYSSQPADLASAASSGSDIEIDNSSPGVAGSEIKKKKKKKHKKQKQQDDMVGSDDGKVNRQEVFVVPDNMPTSADKPYDYQAANQSSDVLAMNGYDAQASGSPTAVSPTGSSDEVGDKLAPGVQPPSKKDKLMGFLTHKKK